MKKLLFIILYVCTFVGAKAQATTGDTAIYSEVDKRPEFIGGKSKFYTYLGHTVRYPANARTFNIQGKVELSFVLEKDGSLSNFRIVKSAGPDPDGEALRVLRKSPKWLPGVKDGQPVRTSHQEPINFILAPD